MLKKLIPRRGDSISTMWDRSNRKNLDNVPTYCPPLPFRTRANTHPLEQEHMKFTQQVKGIPINTPFIDSLSKVPKYANFLQDLINTRQQLEKDSKVILSKQSSKVIMGELPKKMGDPGCLTHPCKFGYNMKTYAIADSGASVNLMSFSFYQNLNLPDLKSTRRQFTWLTFR